MPQPTENESPVKFSLSTNQIVVLGLALILFGAFLVGRQFNLFGGLSRAEPVAIPSGAPYAEATVIGAYDGVILAKRTNDVGTTTPQRQVIEILTDEKTVFAKIDRAGPMRISWTKISEGDTIWVYNRVRTMEETLAEPVDPRLSVPFEESLRNPRERVIAGYVVVTVPIKKK